MYAPQVRNNNFCTIVYEYSLKECDCLFVWHTHCVVSVVRSEVMNEESIVERFVNWFL